jgi:hypothetical protein
MRYLSPLGETSVVAVPHIRALLLYLPARATSTVSPTLFSIAKRFLPRERAPPFWHADTLGLGTISTL